MSVRDIIQAAAGAAGSPTWDLEYAKYGIPAGVTPGDISTLSPGPADYTAAITTVYSAYFSQDGTQLYWLRNASTINQYTLTYPWAIQVRTLTTSFSVATQSSVQNGIFLSPDGTKLYVSSDTGVSPYPNDCILQYSLGTAWDVSTASFVDYFSVATETTSPGEVRFKPNGTKMYVQEQNSNKLYEYALSTAWDVTSASYSSTLTTVTTARAFEFNSDGSKLYVNDTTNDRLYEYGLSTAWDISSATQTQFKAIALGQGDNAIAMYLKDDCAFYLFDSDIIWTYVLGYLDLNPQENSPQGVEFKPDGTKMYITGSSGDEINEYDLSTAWDISTTSASAVLSVSAYSSAPSGVRFNDDGTKMSLSGFSTLQRMTDFNVGTAWSITTAGAVYGNTVSQCNSLQGFYFTPDGTGCYLVDSGNDEVYQFSLSTPFVFDSRTYIRALSVTAGGTEPTDIYFKPDGTKMFLIDNSRNSVTEWELSTAWDISSASITRGFGVPLLSPSGLYFSPDGDKFFVCGLNPDYLMYFTIGA